MTDEERAAIRARAEAATPGPWECRNAGGTTHAGEVIRLHRVRRAYDPGPNGPSPLLAESNFHNLGCDQEDANMAFIAHAREDVPALLDEVERLREAVTYWQGVAVRREAENARYIAELREVVRAVGAVQTDEDDGAIYYVDGAALAKVQTKARKLLGMEDPTPD